MASIVQLLMGKTWKRKHPGDESDIEAHLCDGAMRIFLHRLDGSNTIQLRNQQMAPGLKKQMNLERYAMYCTEKCPDLMLCKKTGVAETSLLQQTAIRGALAQLEESLQSTNESIANCFVFTLENRNRLMDRIAEVKTQATIYGCGYLQELASLAEIVIMLLFRSNHYRDHQGLAQIEDAVQQMQLCFATNTLSEGHRLRIAETIENLWRWVDLNTMTSIRHF